jgi:hypothetical protein
MVSNETIHTVDREDTMRRRTRKRCQIDGERGNTAYPAERSRCESRNAGRWISLRTGRSRQHSIVRCGDVVGISLLGPFRRDGPE